MAEDRLVCVMQQMKPTKAAKAKDDAVKKKTGGKKRVRQEAEADTNAVEEVLQQEPHEDEAQESGESEQEGSQSEGAADSNGEASSHDEGSSDDDQDEGGEEDGENGEDDGDEEGEDEEGGEEELYDLKEEAREYRDKIERRGVVYLSTVPPFMKPAKVKHLLERFGVITRLFLVEEDASTRRKRTKAGGSRKRKYTEGWVEFEDKKVAKMVAQDVNGTLIGGKKRNFYHDDMWNIKYLKGFKWRHLTEKLAYERRVREQKLRVEMMQAKKENAHFLQLVDQKKAIEGMEARKKKRKAADGGGEGQEEMRVVRKFRQMAPITGEGAKSGVDRKLLESVFAGKKKK